MKTLHHPNLPAVTREVPDADVEAWTDEGWRRTKPKTGAHDSTAATTAADKGQPSGHSDGGEKA